MKRNLCAVIMLAMIAAAAFAQEEGAEQTEQQAPQAQQQADPRAAMAAAMAAEGIKRPGEITTPMGTITFHGMVMTGLQGYMTDNTAVDGDEEEWGLMAWDPVWQENAAKLSLTYDNGKYGGYIMVAAEDWNGNIEGIEAGFNTVYMPYAFIWRSFFDNKFKVTIGKLYGEDYQTRDRIWKAEGASQGGWQFSDSNNYLAARLEFKPIEGLNVGAQWSFLPLGQSTRASGLPDLAESFKEVGLAAEYKSSLFNILAGVRFDGADGMNKYDTYSYLKDYYGEWGYLGAGIQNNQLIQVPGALSTLAIHWKHGDEVYGTVDQSPQGNFSTANADKPFSGSTRAIFGFNYKGVKNLTAKMQASFWNLGDFERFGTGSFDETIGYDITPQFNAKINFYQDFYGGDAFPDNMINSPYFRFEPAVSYQLTRNIGANLLFTYGVCKDVVESDWRLKPGFVFTLGGFGALRAELYYELNAITYTDEAVAGAQANYIAKMMQAKGGEAIYKHNICLSVMWMF
ncbi:MAG: hypothetical protein LBD18_06310 [Treponema sp.]|jgi:hypothetical protein|nr:hypothetical protein [Treponema sp.]